MSSSGEGRPCLRDQLDGLCGLHYERLVRFALGLVDSGDRVTAEDIVHSAALALIKKGERLPEAETEKLKVAGGFIGTAAMKYPSWNKGRRETDLPDNGSGVLGDETDAGDVLDQIILHGDVERALTTLTDAEREVVELRVFEGLPYAEIANRRQRAVSTCKNQWASVKDKLRLVLRTHYDDRPG